MNIEKDIFNIFIKYSKDNYEMKEQLVKYVNKQINETKLECKQEAYFILTELIHSINNAGWEERHSEQISFINKMMNKLYDEIEELNI